LVKLLVVDENKDVSIIELNGNQDCLCDFLNIPPKVDDMETKDKEIFLTASDCEHGLHSTDHA